jgi:hypothetical protein
MQITLGDKNAVYLLVGCGEDTVVTFIYSVGISQNSIEPLPIPFPTSFAN